MCHTFVPNLRAIQQNSSHHSTHQNSIRRTIRQDVIHQESMTCQWYKHVPSALVPEFPELVSDFKFSRPEMPVFDGLWHRSIPLDCPLDFHLFSSLFPFCL